MRKVVQLLSMMVSIHGRLLELVLYTQSDRSESSKVQEFLHLVPQVFTGSSPTDNSITL